LVLIVVALVLAWPQLFRAVVLARIHAMTGRPAHADTLALDVWHGRLTVRGLCLDDRDGSPLATIGRLDAQLHLRALLGGHLLVRDITVRDSTVHVVRLTPHEFNISDIIERTRGSGGRGRRLDVTVERFDLEDASVVLEDRSLEPTRTWKSENIRIAARNLSTRRDDGAADGSTTIDGSPVTLRMSAVRLYPIHFQAVVDARGIDLAVARLYLPADAPVVLERGRLDTTIDIAMDARSGLRVDVDGRAVGMRFVRRRQRDPFLLAPAVRFTVNDLGVGAAGGISVGRVELAGATTLFNGNVSPPVRFDLPRITLSAEGLAWPVRGPARVALTSPVPGGGEFSVRGAVTPQPASADVHVRLTRVNVTPWARYLAPALTTTGSAEVALDVHAALQPALSARGTGIARVTGVTIADGARRLLRLESAEARDLDLQWPSRVTIGRVRLRRPDATVERDASGTIVLPTLKTPLAGDAGAPPAARSVSTPARPASAPPASAGFGSLTVAVGEVAVESGAVTWHDRSVKPAAEIRLTGVRAIVKEPTWPPAGPLPVEAAVTTPRGGGVKVNGRVGFEPMSADVRITARGVALAPYAPYARTGAPIAGYADADVFATLTRGQDLSARVRGTLGVARISVDDGRRRVVDLERVDARGVDVEWPRHIGIARVTVRKPWVLVERDEQGGFPLRRLLFPSAAASNDATSPPSASPASPAPSSPPAASEPAPRPTIAVADLEIQDGGARFVDRSVSPPYAEDMSRAWVRIRDLTTENHTPARLELRATMGRGGAVAARGRVAAVEGPLLVEVTTEVRDLAMPRLNPYLRHYAGWKATGGRLSTKVVCRVKGDELHATSETNLAHLTVVRVARDEAGEHRLGLPLGMLVALLKDRHGDIKLSLPIGGRLNDPRFDFHEAIWGAVRTVAVKTIAPPVSWVGRLKTTRDSRIQDVEIDPLGFVVGKAALASDGASRVERLAAFMQTLPAVRLVATPVVSVGDIEALKTAAIESRIQKLAAERKTSEPEAARRLFVEQFPDQAPPVEMDGIVDALRKVEPPPADEAATLAKQRAEAVREALKAAGVDADRIALKREPGALDAFDAGRVEFALTDQPRARNTLVELLRRLVEALERRLATLRGRG
jgi:hypothetical protein